MWGLCHHSLALLFGDVSRDQCHADNWYHFASMLASLRMKACQQLVIRLLSNCVQKRETFCCVTHLGSIRLSVMLSPGPEDCVLDPGWKLCPATPDLLSSELLELRNGGCVGWGISWSLLIILTTTDIDGLNSADACAQSNPICSSLHASSAGKLPSRAGSTISDSLFDP